MMILSGSYLLLYGLLVTVGIIGVRKHVKKESEATDKTNDFSVNDLTVIIPFRNEEQRMKGLLESIQSAKVLPYEFLFVDDASDDASVELISKSLQSIPFQILQSKDIGKKAAIQTGITHTKTNYVLTLDADVRFSQDYFIQLEQLAQADMHVLPVQMHAASWKKLFEMDVYMVNSLNMVANGFSRSIAASGANLLFRKSAYDSVNSLHNHQHIASGDDQFLLADFNQHNKTILLHTKAQLSVVTDVPKSLKEFVTQRLRWIQKTPYVKDALAMKIGIAQVVMIFLFLTIILMSLCSLNWKIAIIFVALKTLLDLLLVATYFKNIQKLRLLMVLPIYELLLPFYTILLALLSLFYRPKWKGR